LIDNFFDIWGLIDPERLLFKTKFHVIAHLPDDIRRFGPSVLYSTQLYECWNGVFRLCSILSNHGSPSHDIGLTLADMDRFKHQVSGGAWQQPDGRWVTAGKSTVGLFMSDPTLRGRLGMVAQSTARAGESSPSLSCTSC
jgi:hypothetical protein